MFTIYKNSRKGESKKIITDFITDFNKFYDYYKYFFIKYYILKKLK